MEKIAGAVAEAVKRVFGLADFVESEVEMTVPPAGTGADYSTNVALKLAKRVGKNPMETALGIVSKLTLEGFEVAVAAPGFLNFISRDEYLKGELVDFERDFEKNISQGEYSGKVVVTEFSDPNPFKVLHVGHLYTSVMGEAISRLIENAGGEVHRVNFGGDVGLHVAKTLWVLQTQTLNSSSERVALSSSKDSDPRQPGKVPRKNQCLRLTPEILAEAYVAGTRAYEEDERAKAEIVEINKRVYDIALNDKHDSELAELYWEGREVSYAYFDDFYAKIGVKFEKYYPESTVAGLGLDKVREQIGSVYEKSDGAVVFRGEKYGLHTRVFINKEGLPTYEAKDTGLLFRKFEDYGFDESVVITGNDIIEYMKVVLKSISLYAPELTERTRHITHGNVRLPGNEKMSSRKGNFLRAVDVVEMVREALRGLRGEGEVDERVVMAALKYAFLKYRIGGDIIFDVKESVSMTGNSGPYILYSVVRAKKILEKLQQTGSSEVWTCSSSKLQQDKSSCNLDTRKSGLNLIKTSEESVCRSLSKKLLQYKGVVAEATREKAPHILCNYLFEMAQEFSKFYEKVKVAGSEQEEERAQLVRIFVRVMEHGLGLLGIEVPEEM